MVVCLRRSENGRYDPCEQHAFASSRNSHERQVYVLTRRKERRSPSTEKRVLDPRHHTPKIDRRFGGARLSHQRPSSLRLLHSQPRQGSGIGNTAERTSHKSLPQFYEQPRRSEGRVRRIGGVHANHMLPRFSRSPFALILSIVGRELPEQAAGNHPLTHTRYLFCEFRQLQLRSRPNTTQTSAAPDRGVCSSYREISRLPSCSCGSSGSSLPRRRGRRPRCPANAWFLPVPLLEVFVPRPWTPQRQPKSAAIGACLFAVVSRGTRKLRWRKTPWPMLRPTHGECHAFAEGRERAVFSEDRRRCCYRQQWWKIRTRPRSFDDSYAR